MLLSGVSAIQTYLLIGLSIAALGLEVWALVTACRFRKDAYPAAGKQTKVLWVSILAVATALGVLYVQGGVLSFLSIASVAASAVFLVGVRPALKQVSGRGGRPSGGPYGGW